MITVLKGKPEHVHGIIQVCSDGYRNTYQHSHSSDYIDRVIEEFYNEKRISDEVIKHSRYWNGWFAAIEHNHVVGEAEAGWLMIRQLNFMSFTLIQRDAEKGSEPFF